MSYKRARPRRTFDARLVHGGVDGECRRPAEDQARDRQPEPFEAVAQRKRALQPRPRGLATLVRIGVPDVAVVGVEAVGDQVREPIDQGIERDGLLPRSDPGAAHAHFEVDQDGDRTIEPAQSLRQRPGRVGVIDQGAERRRGERPDELGQAGDVRPDERVGEQDVAPPEEATISASAIVAHLCLCRPSASAIRTTAGILCVLTWGRSRSAPRARAIIASRLRRTRARKTSSDGLNSAEGSVTG
jgi:hypothetical protein